MHFLVYRPLITSWSYSIRSLRSRRVVLAARLLSTQEDARSNTAILDFPHLDGKWRKRWSSAGKQPVKDGAEKAYILSMFPYPSGALHMGHLRVYTITDVLARFKRMQGYTVLYPMAWDAFGLPAENAALERGLDPGEWTKENIAKMKEQLKGMNGDIDWSREFMTCDPLFYKHTQRIFLMLHERGLAYQADSVVNHDPIDRTVLANEQIDSNGFSWRSGAKVEKIQLKQWFLRITAFQEALLEDLDSLQQWPERVVAMQRNWLGRSKGSKIKFDIDSQSGTKPVQSSVSVFTTRPDTLFGVQFLAVSPSHPLVAHFSHHDNDLQAFLEALPSTPCDTKIGYQLQGVTARNPLAHLSNMPASIQEPLPVYVAPYVMDGYGEGAVMGVPGHDTRDWDFWKQNCGIEPIRKVVIPSDAESPKVVREGEEVFTSLGELASSCGKYSGFASREAADSITFDLGAIGGYAEATETWKLRDWLISRQRYWGTPIPIIHCNNCGPVPVPAEELPVQLPKLGGTTFRDRTGNPLEHAKDWINVPCPKCSKPAKRDTDTMDTFACSSWYMFRFTDPHNSQQPFSPENANANMPVDIYVGGIEHAILHLLYARFISKFLSTTSLWPSGSSPSVRGEPFRQQISQGMVHGKTYSDPATGRFLKPEELDLADPANPRMRHSGNAPAISFEKMSKSKYNGVDPSGFIARYGADVTRAHMLFQAPVTEVLEWDEQRIAGVQRWLQRLHRFMLAASEALGNARLRHGPSANDTNAAPPQPYPEPDPRALGPKEAELYLATSHAVASITHSLAITHALNTCISDLMTLTNTLTTQPADTLSAPLLYHTTSTAIRLTAPFAPAFAEECWELLHAGSGLAYPVPTNIPPPPPDAQPIQTAADSSIFNHAWPTAPDQSILDALAGMQKQTCAVMENGKLRLTVPIAPVPEELESRDVEGWVLAQIDTQEEGRAWLERKRERGWRRVVVVGRGRTVNFVG